MLRVRPTFAWRDLRISGKSISHNPELFGVSSTKLVDRLYDAIKLAHSHNVAHLDNANMSGFDRLLFAGDETKTVRALSIVAALGGSSVCESVADAINSAPQFWDEPALHLANFLWAKETHQINPITVRTLSHFPIHCALNTAVTNRSFSSFLYIMRYAMRKCVDRDQAVDIVARFDKFEQLVDYIGQIFTGELEHKNQVQTLLLAGLFEPTAEELEKHFPNGPGAKVISTSTNVTRAAYTDSYKVFCGRLAKVTITCADSPILQSELKLSVLQATPETTQSMACQFGRWIGSVARAGQSVHPKHRRNGVFRASVTDAIKSRARKTRNRGIPREVKRKYKVRK